MSRRYFLTEEGAERHLEWRKKHAIKRLKAEGEKVIGDKSMVFQSFKWEKGESLCGIPTMRETDKRIYYAILGIITQSQKNDLEKFAPWNYDVVGEIEKALVNELPKKIDKGIINKLFELKDKEK
jgi:hypothetical protein